jgi:hypothetical protein
MKGGVFMYKGKNRCRILKQIRQKIADENDIPFVTSECKYKGDCAGTCPKCESELRYLEAELEKRRSLGRKVSVAGVALAVSLSTAGCAEIENIFKKPELQGSVPADIELDGDVAYPDDVPADEDNIEIGEVAENEPDEMIWGDYEIGGAFPAP